MKRSGVVLALTVFVGTLASCGGSQKSLSIGALYPTAGPQGVPGTQEQRGAQLAAEWANAHGGVNGAKIHLVTVAADRPEAAPAAMTTLQKRGIDIVVGSHASTISDIAAQVATEQKMLLWETGAVGQTDGGVTGGTNFIRMAPMGANLGGAAIGFMRDQLTRQLHPAGPLRYGIAYVDDVYGRAVAAGAAAEIARSGQVLAGQFPYPLSTKDFSDVARRIGESHTDVLFVSAYLDDAVALLRATVAAKVPLVASIGTSSSYCMPAFGEQLGTQATGLFASDKPDAADVNPQALQPEGRTALAWVEKRYRERYHEEMTAPALSGFSNAYALFVHVLPAAKDGTPAAAAAAAMAIKLPEGTLANGGGMDIAPAGAPDAGNNRAAASVIWEWLPGGKRVVVWPPAFANHAVEPLPIA